MVLGMTATLRRTFFWGGGVTGECRWAAKKRGGDGGAEARGFHMWGPGPRTLTPPPCPPAHSQDCVQKTIARLESKLSGRVLKHVVFMLRSSDRLVQQRAAMSLARLAPVAELKNIFVDKKGVCAGACVLLCPCMCVCVCPCACVCVCARACMCARVRAWYAYVRVWASCLFACVRACVVTMKYPPQP